ncbi:mitochondrial putative trans-2-enoyl-CoA reductase [Favolaschia claudopus]|uniref:enoyl-[acyl-carrier-protein] reductase n=1 Tax=Favolaschia claudopus TaxID=2862362 RepID=A0AAW0BVS5_9AGAR
MFSNRSRKSLLPISGSRTSLPLLRTTNHSLHRFSCIRHQSNRAVIYTENGDPTQVLRTLTYKPLPSPQSGTVNIKYLLAPINPADINVIQGVYPAKPTLTSLVAGQPEVFVGGNEGLGEITQIGPDVSGMSVGDWVVMTKAQAGTWSSARNVGAMDILKLPRVDGLSEVHAATMTVNPPTAYNMLNDYVALQNGDWVVQNGANSAVGQAVIQIAASRGLKTLNLVRKRPDIGVLTEKLKALGATEVLSYDDLADRSLTQRIMKEWTAGKGFKLGLNCVSGPDTTAMARLLGQDAYLVSYGAMSKQPLSLPTSLFIFKNLTSAGFWQSRWYKTHPREDKESLMKTLVDLVAQRKLQAPEHEIVTIAAGDSDEVAGQRVRDIFAKISQGQYGKKVLLKFETTQ